MTRELTAARAQSIAEFVVVFGAVLLALGAMTVYVKRGVQAKLKASTDDLLRIREEDAAGVETQRKGITAAIPRGLDPALNPADYRTDVEGDAGESYGGNRVAIHERAHIERTGTEIYKELEGPSSPKTSGGINK